MNLYISVKKVAALCLISLSTAYSHGYSKKKLYTSELTQDNRFVKPFKLITLNDVSIVGGKNASLGQMIRHLSAHNINVPDGFAITTEGYKLFIDENNLHKAIAKLELAVTEEELSLQATALRAKIINGHMPDALRIEIEQAYTLLCLMYGTDTDVAVRSSGTAEDMPDASFAGQQDTYLNIRGIDAILEHYKKCIASLFNERAILYRIEQGYSISDTQLSVGIQKMVRSDLACSGVAFSLDTETGNQDIITITGSYGLGEMIVQGTVTPDEFRVHKPTFKQGHRSLFSKMQGNKNKKLMYHNSCGTVESFVAHEEQMRFCLTDDEVLALAQAICTIEDHYSKTYGHRMPMDIEWAKDGIDESLYILQARPETVHSQLKQQSNTLTTYHLIGKEKPTVLLSGQSVGQHIVSGKARVITDLHQAHQLLPGEILITPMTDPDWVPAMKRAAAVITDHGGRTCHAAIVSRELGIPALVGTGNATAQIRTGDLITIDCSQGHLGNVYAGNVAFEKKILHLDILPELPVKIFVNIAEPSSAFNTARLPVDGVGLARVEFIINNAIKAHPMAFIHPERVHDQAVLDEITRLTHTHESPAEFFIDSLAQGVATIAAAFYPRPVIVRMSDFKSNEYAHLLGGSFFEPQEENPMIGFRGASRYYDSAYQDAFALECKAMKRVRDEMGFTNVELMLPFVRTTGEAEKTIAVMEQQGLKRGENNLRLIMMCEIPSNVICIDEFSAYFDGFSIGSNDLTQLTLGVDRDSGILMHLFDERDLAVKRMLNMAIEGALRNNKYIGICGQGPSDYPEIAQFLIECGIHTLSLNADTVMPFIMRHANAGSI